MGAIRGSLEVWVSGYYVYEGFLWLEMPKKPKKPKRGDVMAGWFDNFGKKPAAPKAKKTAKKKVRAEKKAAATRPRLKAGAVPLGTGSVSRAAKAVKRREARIRKAIKDAGG